MTPLWSALCVVAPLLAAITQCIKPRWGAATSIGAVSLVLLGGMGLAMALIDGGVQTISLGGWSAPLGIAWRIDGLTVTMILITGAVGLPVSVYAHHYFAGVSTTADRFFWPLWMLLLAALSSLFLSNDLFNWYVTLELLSLSAVAMVALAGTPAALAAAQRYLYASLLGSLCYLMGVALIYTQYGSLDMTLLREVTEANSSLWVAIGLMFAGLLMKSAIFPLHFWLPAAHGAAPAPVSAILSALVVKGAFYILLRLWFDLIPHTSSANIALLLGGFGAAAVLGGSLQALRATRLKMLVAYSTVAQLGYLMLFFPLSASGALGQSAIGGIVYFIAAHACAKAAMFLAAGNLQHAAGHDRISALAATAQVLPLSMFAFAIAGISIMGLPPSGGFVAKWILLTTAITNGVWIWVAVLILGGLLSAAYIFRVLALSFTNPEPPVDHAATTHVARASEWASLVLAAMALLLGINAMPILELVSIGLPVIRP
jgi:multicomponent Na+:H+ antiporter subunit D